MSNQQYAVVDDIKFFLQGLKDATIHIFTENTIQNEELEKKDSPSIELLTKEQEKEVPKEGSFKKVDKTLEKTASNPKFRSVYNIVFDEKIENQNNNIHQLNFKCFRITIVPFIVLLILDFIFLPILNSLASFEPSTKVFYEFAKIFRLLAWSIPTLIITSNLPGVFWTPKISEQYPILKRKKFESKVQENSNMGFIQKYAKLIQDVINKVVTIQILSFLPTVLNIIFGTIRYFLLKIVGVFLFLDYLPNVITFIITLPFMIPIGQMIIFCLNSWIFSYYVFSDVIGYKLMGYPMEESFSYFERRWLYFLGFGTPAAIITMILPFDYNNLIVWCFYFPVCVTMTVWINYNFTSASKVTHIQPLPIFGLARKLLSYPHPFKLFMQEWVRWTSFVKEK